MTGEEALEKLKALKQRESADGDIEEIHQLADDVLRELLISLGHAAVIEEYDRIFKWFS